MVLMMTAQGQRYCRCRCRRQRLQQLLQQRQPLTRMPRALQPCVVRLAGSRLRLHLPSHQQLPQVVRRRHWWRCQRTLRRRGSTPARPTNADRACGGRL